MKLPVIPTSCTGCGACCLEQNSPPGFIVFLGPMADEYRQQGPFAQDAKLFDSLPPDALNSLQAYAERLITGGTLDGEPCIWLDLETKRCRHYEHRPTICRDALLLGDDGCMSWREEYPQD